MKRFQFTCHLPLAAQCPTGRGRTTCGVIHRTPKKALAHVRALNATVMERWQGTRLSWHTLGYLSGAGGDGAAATHERAPAGHVAPVDALGLALGGLARQVLQQRLGLQAPRLLSRRRSSACSTPLTNR